VIIARRHHFLKEATEPVVMRIDKYNYIIHINANTGHPDGSNQTKKEQTPVMGLI